MAIAAHATNAKHQPTLDGPSKTEAVNHFDPPECAKETARIAVEEIDRRFSMTNMPIEKAIAMATDPRTKGHVDAFPITMQHKIFSQASEEVSALCKAFGMTREIEVPAPAAVAELDDEDFLYNLMARPTMPGGANLQLQVTADIDVPVWQQHLEPEVLFYLQQGPLIQTSKDFNPLQWWMEQREDNSSPLVHLPVIAALHLSLACTAARNQRTFSSAGSLLDGLRSRFNSDLVANILFIQRNLHLLYRTVKRDITVKQSESVNVAEAKVRAVDIDAILQAYIGKHGRVPPHKKSAN